MLSRALPSAAGTAGAARRRWATRLRRVGSARTPAPARPAARIAIVPVPLGARGAVEFLVEVTSAPFAAGFFFGGGCGRLSAAAFAAVIIPAASRAGEGAEQGGSLAIPFLPRAPLSAPPCGLGVRGGLRIIGTAIAALAVALRVFHGAGKSRDQRFAPAPLFAPTPTFFIGDGRRCIRAAGLAALIFTAIRYAPERLREADLPVLRSLSRNARKFLSQRRLRFGRGGTPRGSK